MYWFMNRLKLMDTVDTVGTVGIGRVKEEKEEEGEEEEGAREEGTKGVVEVDERGCCFLRCPLVPRPFVCHRFTSKSG